MLALVGGTASAPTPPRNQSALSTPTLTRLVEWSASTDVPQYQSCVAALEQLEAYCTAQIATLGDLALERFTCQGRPDLPGSAIASGTAI